VLWCVIGVATIQHTLEQSYDGTSSQTQFPYRHMDSGSHRGGSYSFLGPSMKITKFRLCQWHSINLVPLYSWVPMCEDEPPFRVFGRLFQLTVLGWLVSLVVEYRGADGLAYISKVRGPLYSRKRKVWYRDLD
jgi:hypothetical protein